MRPLERTLLIVAAIAVGGVAWFLYTRQDAAQRELARETASLRARLEQAERSRDSELPRAIAEGLRRSAPLPAPAASGQLAPTALGEAGVVPPAALARSEAMAQRLEQLVSSEPADARWSSETTAAARTVFASVTGSRLVTADCQTSLCRFVVTSDSLDAQRGLADQLVGQGPFNEEVWYYYDHESTPPKATLYTSRKGVPLSALLGDASQPR
jgi:hypothetical protein